MEKNLPPKPDRETLRQLATEQLIEMVMEQALAIEALKTKVIELEIVIEKLKVSRDLDSTTSSKPPSADILKEWIKLTQPNIHADETPWVVKGVKEWLWIFANTDFALFHAADTRSRAELEAILGSSYEGVLSSDDFSAYNGYPVKAQQKCQAHLRRHFKKLIKLPGLNNKEIGSTFLNLIDEGFKNYALFQKTHNIDEFSSWASEFKLKVEFAIHSWIDKAGGEAGKLLRSLRNKAHQWWYFLDHPHIPPDNNLAERTLRLAVTKRKVSGGSRTRSRFQDTANLLTVIQTCRRQGRSVIEFFTQAIKAMVNPNVQTPDLIPQI
ncbi:IS66 family transposase [Dolichospermum flos-aquae]|jgi:transposase|uniref:IS66 family transposase n=1 Tax=Dolichospermum flos-aquae CCAP 1403/13F TaxID=315271 RepID=A0A6H2BYC6_DOLFA|nr:IS66 family transposase [Dolichospermum flos-aquae]QJB43928.1 IS66 family transposase [Dolichospermum flos-aquae CCAP 1403/13F]